MKISKSLRSLAKDLRRSILMLLIMLCCATALFVVAISQYRALLKAHDAEQLNLSALESSVTQLRGELDSAQKFIEPFDALKGSGVLSPFGKQSSLDQVDRLMQIGWVLPKSYALAAQVPLEGTLATKLAQHVPFKHSLKFELSLPHELRLLRLIDALASKSFSGLSTVESCEMERKSPQQKSGEVQDRSLTATCTLHWYHLTSKAENVPALEMKLGERP